MKKSIVIVVLLFLSLNATCQWYYKTYGVKDLSLLTRQQLDYELKTANGYIGIGFGGIILGALGLWGAATLIENAYNSPDWESGLARGFGGGLLLMISTGFEVVGIIFLIKGMSRSSEINKVLKNSQVKVGIIKVPDINFSPGAGMNSCPALSVTFNF
jgi:hypothetical protein